MIFLGLVLLLIGFFLPFVMLLRILEPTLLLSFVAYLSSLAGLVLGLIGLALYSRAERQGRG